MLRIFLVVEDIKQMNSLKVLLSKLGCIVETSVVELGIKDQVVAFRPEVVITSGTGKKINPIHVNQKAREANKDLKLILLINKGSNLSLGELAESRYDMILETPVEPLKLLATLNQFSTGKHNIDLVEKYQKLIPGMVPVGNEVIVIPASKPEAEPEKMSVFGNKFSTSVDSAARVKAYETLTAGLTLSPKSTISKTAARAKVSELKKDWDMKRLEEIDEEKRKMVKELFRKK
jgi:hypothetical protein